MTVGRWMCAPAIALTTLLLWPCPSLPPYFALSPVDYANEVFGLNPITHSLEENLAAFFSKCRAEIARESSTITAFARLCTTCIVKVPTHSLPWRARVGKQHRAFTSRLACYAAVGMGRSP